MRANPALAPERWRMTTTVRAGANRSEGDVLRMNVEQMKPQADPWAIRRAAGGFLPVLLFAVLVPEGGCGGVAIEPRGAGGSAEIGDGSPVPEGGGGASGAGQRQDALAPCKSASTACLNSGDCCEGYCWGGLCQRPGCALPAGHCGTTDDCCAPAGSVVCIQGYCVAAGAGVPDPPDGSCRSVTLACTTDGECCDGYCLDRRCQPPACARLDAPCTATSDCCSLTELLIRCASGVCITVTGH
jgi:hypothetical protein